MKSKMILGFLFLFLLAGITWQNIMTKIESSKCLPVGEYVDVKSYNMHYYTKGTGDTAFVFITGSGTPCAYTDFYVLLDELSAIGQTISFDHAGSGWSLATDEERTIDIMANELSILIDTVAPNKSIVLICHSLGSLEAIRYTQMNQEMVRGIIFLDSGSPEFYSTDSEFAAKMLNRGIAFVRGTGLLRVLGKCGVTLPFYGEKARNDQLSDETKRIDEVMFFRLAGNANTLSVIDRMNENAKVVLNGGSLGDIPILVISSDSGDEWQEVQKQLTLWSENSESILIEKSEHYLHWSNTEQVVDSIRRFLEKIKDFPVINSST